MCMKTTKCEDKSEECFIDKSVTEINNLLKSLSFPCHSGLPHLTPVESCFYEAKNGNQFWQGKTDGNSGVKCHLLRQSGLEPPTTGFTSHSEAVPWFYVQHPPSDLSCSQALSTLYCPQLQCISCLEPSLSAISMEAQLYTAPKQTGRPCDQ